MAEVPSEPVDRLVHIGAKIPAELAEAVAQLARNGDRTLSAEIRRACREHVANEDPGAPPLGPEPAQRDGTSDLERQSSPPQLAGPREAA